MTEWADSIRYLWRDSIDCFGDFLDSSSELKAEGKVMAIDKAEGRDDVAFVISRVFEAPRQMVWDAWAKPEQMAQWFGPRGVTTTVEAFELRPGGTAHSRMERPDGGLMWAKFVYREVEERLVWVHSFSDEQANVVRAPFFDGLWPLELLTTIDLKAEGEATRVTLTWIPIVDTTDEERRTFAANMPSMTQGWKGSFAQLDRFLGGPA